LRSKRGLNENYAREIMELHTLGVDGGYTQKDVAEVARCLTGWTIRGLREGRPEFYFFPRLHGRGEKVVLGTAIRASAEDEGRGVIHLLASHPATARLIATKLARKLVADEPPRALVDRAARLMPDNIEYLQRRAGYLAEFGRLSDARADLDHSIVLHDRPYLRYERAAVLYAMGEYRLASEDLDGAIGAQPGNTQFYPCRAVVRAALGRFEEARTDAQVSITRMAANGGRA
jgi:tetratricopeptide (TPR) repeat protein